MKLGLGFLGLGFVATLAALGDWMCEVIRVRVWGLEFKVWGWRRASRGLQGIVV